MKPLQTHLAQEIDDALKTGRPFAFAMFPGETDIMRFGSGQPSDGCSFDVSPWLGLFGNRIRIDGFDSAVHTHLPKMQIPDSSTPRDIYLRSVDTVSRRCRERNGKTVLSRAICGSLPQGASIGSIACRFFASYPQTFRHIYFTPSTGCWIGATPEVLLDFDKTSGRFATMAFAGTRRRGAETAWDEKNIGENRFVIDYIAEQLHAQGIDVEMSPLTSVAFGDIEHLCCHITGQTTPGKLAEMIDAINPTPALCGYPKEDAVKDIKSAELHQRNCYGGFVAIDDGRRYRAFVNLRCMQILGNRFCIYAGGGIVADSDALAELQETEAKSSRLQYLVGVKADSTYTHVQTT